MSQNNFTKFGKHNRTFIIASFLSLTLGAVVAVDIFRNRIDYGPKSANFAKLAKVPECGHPHDSVAELNEFRSKYILNEENQNSQDSNQLTQVVTALPPSVLTLFEVKKIKFSNLTPAFLQKHKNLEINKEVSEYFTSTESPRAAILRRPSLGDLVLVAPDRDQSSTIASMLELGENPEFYRRASHSTLLPAALWHYFENLLVAQSKVSNGSGDGANKEITWMGIKQKFGNLVDLSADDKEYFLRNIDAGGEASSIHGLRSIILFTTNIYCSNTTAKLIRSQFPAASKFFNDNFLCALGKPWYMAEVDFKNQCSIAK